MEALRKAYETGVARKSSVPPVNFVSSILRGSLFLVFLYSQHIALSSCGTRSQKTTAWQMDRLENKLSKTHILHIQEHDAQ